MSVIAYVHVCIGVGVVICAVGVFAHLRMSVHVCESVPLYMLARGCLCEFAFVNKFTCTQLHVV